MSDDAIDDSALPDAPLAALDDEDSRDSMAESQPPRSPARRQPSGGSGATRAASLEDLVGNFDDKVVRALRDLDTSTQAMAPVQVRSVDEAMSESQVWWTLTGNYGNILPLDFNKTQIRRNQIEALALDTPNARADEGADCNSAVDDDDDNDDADEALRQRMDFHSMVADRSRGGSAETPAVSSAEEVIEQIDEMFQTHDLLRSMTTERTAESVDSMYSSMRSPFAASHSDAELKLRHYEALNVSTAELRALPHAKLLVLAAELEQLILTLNTELVAELARRDELEYEKELKNKFITLLVAIQDQRRRFCAERKRKGAAPIRDAAQLPQCVTATVPFDDTRRIGVASLESLVKILEAIHDDNAQVPSLLTEYILTVVCPSSA